MKSVCGVSNEQSNEFGAEVYSGATTEKQAWEVFRPARLMCKRTPMLTEAFGIEVNASNMNRPEDGARFEPLIGNPGDGSSPHCAVVDEYHEHATDALYTTMLTGMGARRQPLMWAITTAGYNIEGPCYDKRREVIEMLNGSVPENVTWLSPEGEYQKWNGTAWVKDAEAEKLFRIREAEEKKTRLIQEATDNITILQDAVNFEMATDEEVSMLSSWKKYRVLVSRIDINTAPDIVWPEL
ncbi:TPA: terminase large subunit domain-containing protein [Escherichia coli]